MANQAIERYDSDGKLLSIQERDGYEISLSYSSGQYGSDGNEFYVDDSGASTSMLLETGLLVRVSDSLGRIIELAYGATNHVAFAVDVAGNLYRFSYDNTWPRLDAIYFPGEDASVTRILNYEDSRFPFALTGINDENGNRFATWAYDDQGRAISSEHAGETDRTTLTYNTDGTTTVTNALGRETTYHFEVIHGVHKVTRVEGHPTDTCAGSNKGYSYDTNGFLASKTDWNGNLTTYVHDARGLETSRTEAAGTPEERTITTEWHPDYRVPTRITEPGKITELSYDADGRLLSRTERAAP